MMPRCYSPRLGPCLAGNHVMRRPVTLGFRVKLSDAAAGGPARAATAAARAGVVTIRVTDDSPTRSESFRHLNHS